MKRKFRKSSLNDDVDQPPPFINHSDSKEAGSQSPKLFSQEVNKEAFREKEGSRSPNLFSQQVNKNLVGEHIQVGNKGCDDTGDQKSQIAMDDKDCP